MTSPRLQVLLRQLAQTEAAGPGEKNDISSRIITAIQSACEAEAALTVKAALAAQKEAEEEAAEQRAEVLNLHKEIERMQRDYAKCSGESGAADKQEQVQMQKAHAETIAKMQATIDFLRQEVAEEQQARARAETQCAAEAKACAKSDSLLAKAQALPAVKSQVVMPPMMKPTAFTLKVSQRTEDGRIAAISAIPITT